MRSMRGLTLAGVAMLAGCLEAKTVHCQGGVICPEGMACARAPVYCAAPARVEACASAEDFATCTVDAVAGACRGGACFPCTDNELAGCPHSGWFPMVSNTTDDLRGVWTSGPGEAYAVGGDTITRYDGFKWTSQTIAGAGGFIAVWGSDSDHVFTTTGTGEIYQRAETDDWVRVREPTGEPLVAIGGSGPDNVIALTPLGAIVRFAGAGWITEPTTMTGALFGFAVQSPSDVFVGASNGTIYRSVGTTWQVSRAAMSSPVPLNAIAAGPTSVFAIGGEEASLHLRGGSSSWIVDPIPGVGGGTMFSGIWASGEDEAFAVANSGTIVRFTDTWAVVASGGPNLSGIHGTDRGNVFTVGVGGTILRYTGP